MKIRNIALLLLLMLPVFADAQTNTLTDARVGEWAVYQTGNGNILERHSVIARRQNIVVVKIETIVNGRTISSKTVNYNAAAPQFLQGAAGNEQVSASGANYDSVMVSAGNQTMYYSNDVPVTGLVLIRRGNQVVKELVNFGR